MTIILFGTGCDLCREIAANVELAIERSGHDISFDKTADIERMLSCGIKSTPSLMINEEIVSISQPLSAEEITRLINERMARS